MRFDTMGLLINRKAYSIAVATLSPTMLEVAPEDIFGQFLVINEPSPVHIDGPTPVTGIRNRLYGPEEFYDFYKILGEGSLEEFFKVKKLRDFEIQERIEARREKEPYEGTVVRPGRPRPTRVRYAGGYGGYAR